MTLSLGQRQPQTSRSRSRVGRCVVIAGPDGTGKSTLSEEVRRRLPGQHLFFHSRPSVLPHRTRSTGPVTDPHRQAPYGRVPSIAKVLYLWIDYLLGWLVLVRPALRSGATVVIERGWWDLAVDQTRYRLDVPAGLIERLGLLLPRPYRTLIMTGDAEVIRRRKPELAVAELARQLAAWKALPAAPLRAVLIDVNAAPERVVLLAWDAAFE